ncbi:MAG TPA: hypothetical protein PLD25_08570 [Chloroflexota bacterium]|nr:hypothetical protein [Chloroflexota bacterium]HUM71912.1 hypothetical protein [Chloroflexota bacterium]
MSLSTVISVGLGLILIYYALGLVVNATTQIVKISFDLRAKALAEVLTDLMGEKSHEFMNLGLIQTLKPLGKRLWTRERDVEQIPKSTFSLSILELLQPQDNQYLVTAVHLALNQILDKVALDPANREKIEKLLEFNNDEELLAQIREIIRTLPDEETFANFRAALLGTLESLITPGQSEDNQLLITTAHAHLNRILAQFPLDKATRQRIGKLLEIDNDTELRTQLSNFVQSFPDVRKVSDLRSALLAALDLLMGSPETQLKRIQAGIQQLPEGSKARKALENALNYGVSDVNQARARIEAWYDDAMKNAGDLFGRRVRRWVILISLIVTLTVGGDTIAIARAFLVQPVQMSQVEDFLNQFPPDAATPSDDEASLAEIRVQMQLISDVLQNLEGLNLPLPWWRGPLPDTASGWATMILGLMFTWLAVSQGSSFWYDILKAIKPGGSPPPPPPKDGDKD